MFSYSLCAVNEVANSVLLGGTYEIRVKHIEVPYDCLDFFPVRKHLRDAEIDERTLRHENAAFDGG